MLFYYDGHIYNDKNLRESNTHYYNNGYYSAISFYELPNGEKIKVQYPAFSNIHPIIVSADDEEGWKTYGYDFDFTVEGFYQDPETSYEIEQLEEEISDLIESGENENSPKIKELQERIRELKDEQQEYDEFIPQDAQEVIYCSNIGLGASTSHDYEYKGYTLYKSDDEYYLEANFYEYSYRGDGSMFDVAKFLLYAWEHFICESALKYIVEHKEEFNKELTEYV